MLLENKVVLDKVYIVTGYKGHPEEVKKEHMGEGQCKCLKLVQGRIIK